MRRLRRRGGWRWSGRSCDCALGRVEQGVNGLEGVIVAFLQRVCSIRIGTSFYASLSFLRLEDHFC